MHLQCPQKEQGIKCWDKECPACLDAKIEEELGDLELTIANQPHE